MTVPKSSLNSVAIIPARGGSKAIPGKNIIDFCGKPLLAWSILQAKAAPAIKEVYVSSNDEEILGIAAQFGAALIQRPPELATDTASSEEALRHALDVIAKGKGVSPDLVVFLQATSPLRSPEDINGAIQKLLETKADSLFSMALLEDFCVWTKDSQGLRGLTFDPFNRGRRQDRPPLYLENGSIYVFRPEILTKYDNRLGGKISMFEMPYWKSYEIDEWKDVEICAYYFEKKLLPYWLEKEKRSNIRAADISLIVYDFDGVMTDNRVIVMQDGNEAIIANRADGLGVERISFLKIPQLILTTERNPVVRARADKLRLEVIGSCQDKRKALQSYCEKNGYDLSRVVFLGNDVNDLEVMKIVGFPVAPGDAHPEVKAIAKFITKAEGGEGVVKELAEKIIIP